MEAQNLNHWTAREIPSFPFWKELFFIHWKLKISTKEPEVEINFSELTGGMYRASTFSFLCPSAYQLKKKNGYANFSYKEVVQEFQ